METPNTSFDRILCDHEKLRGLVADIRVLLDASQNRESWRSDLAQSLRHFQTALVEHFRVEEDPAGFDEIVEQFPRASNAIEGFRADHAQMLKDLDGLVAAVEGEKVGDESLIEATAALLDGFDKHEAAETALVQSLYTQDIGTKD